MFNWFKKKKTYKKPPVPITKYKMVLVEEGSLFKLYQITRGKNFKAILVLYIGRSPTGDEHLIMDYVKEGCYIISKYTPISVRNDKLIEHEKESIIFLQFIMNSLDVLNDFKDNMFEHDHDYIMCHKSI